MYCDIDCTSVVSLSSQVVSSKTKSAVRRCYCRAQSAVPHYVEMDCLVMQCDTSHTATVHRVHEVSNNKYLLRIKFHELWFAVKWQPEGYMGRHARLLIH